MVIGISMPFCSLCYADGLATPAGVCKTVSWRSVFIDFLRFLLLAAQIADVFFVSLTLSLPDSG